MINGSARHKKEMQTILKTRQLLDIASNLLAVILQFSSEPCKWILNLSNGPTEVYHMAGKQDRKVSCRPMVMQYQLL